MYWSRRVPVSVLQGKTLRSVAESDEALIFTTEDGERYEMLHIQDCCEQVSLEDIVGDLDDLVGSPLLLAEEVSSDDPPPEGRGEPESYAWTFYKFATMKGRVTLRWFGESNGYYGMGVDLIKLDSYHA